MHSAEKFAWVAVLIAFTVLEVLAIKRSDEDSRAARDAQNVYFKAIADGLAGSIKASSDQYTDTIHHVDGVLATTQSVASLSRENLMNITGGESFAYVVPDTIFPKSIKIPLEQLSFSMHVKNAGDQPLTGVSVSVARFTGKDFTDLGVMSPVALGTIAPRASMLVPERGFSPGQGYVEIDGLAHYSATITAQNGTIEEEIWFRRSSNVFGWDYKLSIKRVVGPKTTKTLKTVDWTPPVIAPE
jgi:hypothetical protein